MCGSDFCIKLVQIFLSSFLCPVFLFRNPHSCRGEKINLMKAFALAEIHDILQQIFKIFFGHIFFGHMQAQKIGNEICFVIEYTFFDDLFDTEIGKHI